MKNILISLLLLFPLLITAQDSLMQKVFFNPFYPIKGKSLTKAGDSIFVVAGSFSSKPLLMGVSGNGELLWKKQIIFADNNISEFEKVASEGSRLFAAGGEGTDVVISGFNLNGDTLWSNKLDFGYNETLQSICTASDHGVLAVTSWTEGSGVTMLDSAGQIVWSHIYPGVQLVSGVHYDSVNMIIGNGDSGMIVMNLKNNGVPRWIKKDRFLYAYNIDHADTCFYLSATEGTSIRVIKMNEEGFSYRFMAFAYLDEEKPSFHAGNNFCCFAYPGMWGAVLIISKKPEFLWAKGYAMTTCDITEDSDSALMLLGQGPVFSDLSKNHIGLFRIKESVLSECEIFPQYPDTISGPGNSFMENSVITYSAGGNVTPVHPEIFEPDILTDDGCTSVYGAVQEESYYSASVSINPNPVVSESVLIITDKDVCKDYQVQLFNNQGKMVKEFTCGEKCILKKEKLPAGIYFLKVMNSEGVIIGTRTLVIS